MLDPVAASIELPEEFCATPPAMKDVPIGPSKMLPLKVTSTGNTKAPPLTGIVALIVTPLLVAVTKQVPEPGFGKTLWEIMISVKHDPLGDAGMTRNGSEKKMAPFGASDI